MEEKKSFTPVGYYHSIGVYSRSDRQFLCTLRMGIVTNLSRAEKFREQLAIDNPDKFFTSSFNTSEQEFDLPFNSETNV
jgi:hypothetical protein